MARASVLTQTESRETLLYIEGGRLRTASLVAESPRRLRVLDEEGTERKLDRRKVAAQLPAAEAASAVAKVIALAEQLDMAQVWEKSAGVSRTTEELVVLNQMDIPPELGALSILLAHSRDGGYFSLRDGNWQPVTAERAAIVLAARSKRAKHEQTVAQWEKSLAAGDLPVVLRTYLDEHLSGVADLNDSRHRFLQQYCRNIGKSFGQLAVEFDIITDFEQYHLRDLSKKLPPVREDASVTPIALNELEQLATESVSIDAATTTEIDDAFSGQRNKDDQVTLAIHIAAPAFGLSKPAREQAVARCATVYLPGTKHMMLPATSVAAYSLEQGTTKPCVSLLVDWNTRDNKLFGHRFAVGKIDITHNIAIENFSANSITLTKLPSTCNEILTIVQQVASRCNDAATQRPVLGHLVGRDGDTPLMHPRSAFATADRTVAALMVLYNQLAATWLSEQGVPFLQRSKGRLFVSKAWNKPYGWFTSPLRRLADLYNQEQLLAVLRGEQPPHSAASLQEQLQPFNRQYTWIQLLQNKIETLWSLRWLARQEQVQPGSVSADGMVVQLDNAPVAVKLATAATPNSTVQVHISRIDELSLQAQGEVQ